MGWIMHHSVQNCATKGKKTRKKRKTKTLKKIWHTSICRFFKNIYFSVFLFFKVSYHGFCITVFRSVQQKGKKQEKKERPKPTKKFGILVYVDFLKICIFLFFLFLSNLSWIMHHSGQKCTTKAKKKRQTKTPPKIWHTSICRFFKNIYFSFFLFFKKLIMDYASQCSEMYNKKKKK